MTWSSKFVDMSKQDLVEYHSLLEPALDYTWNHFEHQIDSVKHNTKVNISLIHYLVRFTLAVYQTARVGLKQGVLP